MAHFSPFVIETLIAAAVTVGFLGFGHYAPWRLWLGGRDLERQEAYVYGVTCILVPLTVAALLNGWEGWTVVMAAWVLAVTGGLAVIGMYAIDSALTKAAQAREQREIKRLRGGSDAS